MSTCEQESNPPVKPAPRGFVERYARNHNRTIEDMHRLIESFEAQLMEGPAEYDQGDMICVYYDSFFDLVGGAREAYEALIADEGLRG